MPHLTRTFLTHVAFTSLAAVLALGCSTTSGTDGADAGTTSDGTSTADGSTSGDPCQACLDSGGTWQPEAEECTQDCGIQDISCYTDECPGSCGVDNCGWCFDQSACEGAGCTWNVQEEAMWCNAGSGGGDDGDTSMGGGGDDASMSMDTAGPEDDSSMGGGDDTAMGGGDDSSMGGGDDTSMGGGDDASMGGGDDASMGGGDDTKEPVEDTTLTDTTEPASACEECLAQGKTWQPEAEACTDNCAIQDISCFTSACPAPCGPESCDTCFDSGTCAAAGCAWEGAGETMWCTTAPETDDAGTEGDTPEPGEDAGPAEDTTDPPTTPCEACLAEGKTWQPEADACTDNCAIQDISCYTSECPAPCSASSCGTCIAEDECTANGCTWNASGGLFWCSG